ncbi:MAG: undecaprenyldiphospho-muramoylpentapeptide beta-N-acetylglucosaminyltransferase [Bacteroidales bacterium]|nr:undecaprenyldiphospho-muramoylpentapeptide beta-N-acetylglucosaminyltransferase [Candidatus Cacconaster caballi]
MNKPRIIISGGGTGGHIFPAISIANSIREINPDAEILFVGAIGKMEMEKVPAAGYRIVGLPVAGLQRKLSLKNLSLPFKVVGSICKARRIIREFKPDVAVGVGGFASAPLLWSAERMGIPCLIQEQNSYAGLTNKIVSKRAKRICTAYEGMERFFPADRIILTGNPIRGEIRRYGEQDKAEGYNLYGLDPKKKTIFIVGGSLGCGTLNRTMRRWVEERGESAGYQIIWQCGKFYKEGVDEFMKGRCVGNLFYTDFIKRMDLAYAVADVVVSRAGAGTISELCVAGKASIFVPSPNVAEDHQTHNAMALVGKDAALLVKDSEAVDKLIDEMESLLNDDARIASFEENIMKLGRKDASSVIAREVLKLVKE